MAAIKGTVLVTGANGGLGMAIAQGIATSPSEGAVHHALYSVRSTAAAIAVRSALAATKAHPHDILQLDLSKPSSVRETAAAINRRVSSHPSFGYQRSISGNRTTNVDRGWLGYSFR
jgi:NAD(P)-dependent dehydrogenase (short-subunit alcohol dehydrogenase family)